MHLIALIGVFRRQSFIDGMTILSIGRILDPVHDLLAMLTLKHLALKPLQINDGKA